MRTYKLSWYILIHIVVWNFNNGVTEAQMTMFSHHEGRSENEHTHRKEPPCSVCPRQGVCVPHVQCPAHVRPGANNPECHIEGSGGYVGVCCSTGRSHAAESDRKFRTSINIDDIEAAHDQSRQQLSRWLERADNLNDKLYAVVNTSDPSYWHHLSVRTSDAQADMLGRGALLNLLAAHELKARDVITADEIQLGLTEHTNGPFCPPKPFCLPKSSPYRSIRGECNNENNPHWGEANTGYDRLLPPDYSDGFWAMRTSMSGSPLPNARAVSRALLMDANIPSDTHNLIFMQFGQFIVHDISIGVVFALGNGNGISCCDEDGNLLPQEFQHWACAPIVLDANDIFYGQFGRRCMNFVRTQLALRSDCTVGYAKQMNGASHYIDLSQLYGNSEEKFVSLRASGGLLSVFNDFGRELPPLTTRKECLNMHEGAACFESGDNHGNQIISLTILHTIWTREHNRIARALSTMNPKWDNDKVFFESRRILQAEYQHVIYNEWLPLLIGPKLMEIYGLSPSSGFSYSYRPSIDPSLTAEFSAAAMRFGHSIVDRQLTALSPKHRAIYESISIPEVMFQPSRLRLKPFLDRMLMGMSWQPMQTVDPFITESLSRYMFHGGNPYGLDLAAINIQRGRDYGIRSYNEYRKLVGLEPFNDFQQFGSSTATRLSSVYANPEDIDLWVGGLLEKPVEGGIIGLTFANIIADQFSRLKNGDRYFYEFGPNINPGAFTKSQLAEIKKVTLSRIICDNTDRIELFHQSPNAFLKSDLPRNEPVVCSSPVIPTVDLSSFKEM